jgi:hypothetical protein
MGRMGGLELLGGQRIGISASVAFGGRQIRQMFIAMRLMMAWKVYVFDDLGSVVGWNCRDFHG